MKIIIRLFFLCLSLKIFAQTDTSQKIMEGRRNSPAQQNKPYVILISADGFRYDYAEKHGAAFITQYGNAYVKADYLLPSFPSLTFPNHYTLATGLYPAHHGLVDNHFYDPKLGEHYHNNKAANVRVAKWYGGTPLWVLAEQHGMLSASFYWVGTEAPIQTIYPTYYYWYNEAIGIEQRIQTVVNWLKLPADRRPHFISFYFPEVDHEGHAYGPDAPQTGRAVRWVDSAIYRLTEAVNSTGLEVNFILVSDHGMTPVDTANPVLLPPVDTAKATLVWGGELAHIHVKNKGDIKHLVRQLKSNAINYTVYQKNEVPKRLHYRANDDRFGRIGDILLIPDWPYVFTADKKKIKPGAHGYDPFLVTDMRTVFYAWGPAFKRGLKTGPVNNVDVYPVVARILALPVKERIDGRKKFARRILK
jgi:predicted AlkP superfamily pyrophosphatase or phosphodiesterase